MIQNFEQIEDLDVTNDLVFQRIFGKVGNEEITKGFLEKILGIQIDELTLDTNKRLIGEEIDDKIGRIDVKAKLKDGTKVVIEMQASSYKYMPERLLYYWASAYTEGFKKGDKYRMLEKTIAILISKENLGITKGISQYHTKWDIREKTHLDKVFTKNLEIHILELGKYKDGQDDKEKGNWIKFIKDGGKAKMDGKVQKALKEAQEELERLTQDPETAEMYYQRVKDLRDMLSYADAAKEEGIELGMSQGIEQGIEQGIKQGISQGVEQGIELGKKEQQKEIVLALYKRNMPIDEICNIVNLSKENVEEIIGKQNNASK